MRLKDATHVLANIAVPSALALVAQTRDKLLLFWMDEVTAPANADSNRVWEKFLAQRDLAHKILLDIWCACCTRRQKPNPARHEPLEVVLRSEDKLDNFAGRDT